MNNCPFCHLDKEKTRTLEVKKSVFVVLSNPRLMPGHTLVIPKRHVLQPSELKAGERKELFDTVLEYQDKILKRLATGCDIRQHCRPFLKADNYYKVDHLHFHLHPRELEDELYQMGQKGERELFQSLSQNEEKRIIALLSE